MGQPALVAPAVGLEASAVVRVAGFRKYYGRTRACDGIDLAVARGEICGLIGPDGAGKSSLMKAVAGVLEHDAGTVHVFDNLIDSEAAAERVKGRLGFMPQGLGLNLYPDLSVEENIDFFARLRTVPASELAPRKAALLAMTRLAAFRDRPMKHLSGGMKQKLGLICTLIHAPELIILDEPTTGVDPVSRRDFWAILTRLLREQHITALVSTAYLEEAERFQHIALLHSGRVLARGTPDAVRQQVDGQAVWLRSAPQPEALTRLRAAFAQVKVQGEWLSILVPEAAPEAAAAQVRQVLQDLDVSTLEIRPPELEDAFVALLRAEEPERPSRPISAAPAGQARSDGAAIEANQLTRDFGKFRAVDRVSFQVAQGEIFGLLGANGAGKTTAIKMLTGILPPTDGTGRVAGADMRKAPRAIKQRIGYVSQAFSLYTDLSVQENIELYAGIYGFDRSESRRRGDWVLAMTGLDGHEADRAGALPMGLRQRLALGCALIHRPQVLFLDEPTSGVDPLGRRRFWDILFRLAREDRVAILITTHYMSEAEHCDRLALMYAGRLVADAAPETLKREVEAEAGRLLEIDTDDTAAALACLTAAGFGEAAPYGHAIRVLSGDPEADMRELPQQLAAAGVAVRGISPRPLSMEEVFVHRVTRLEREERAVVS